MFNRRHILQMAGLAPFANIPVAFAEDAKFVHALSLFGDIKYPPDFKHFDYVNPAAPKAGKLRQWALGGFDSLNPNSLKGDPAAVTVLEPLMIDSLDEPATRYGLIAESISHPEDFSSVTFRLRPEAKFHDGKSITPEDVVWSFDTLKANLPTKAAYYKNVIKAEQTGEHEVRFTFDQKDNLELPSIVGQLVIMPKHWWTANGPDGKPRDVTASTLEIPLGSGPYKFKTVVPGSSIVMERVADYWGKDLAVNIGQNNFEEMAYLYFQTQLVAFEAFKGDQVDYNYETSSKSWATAYEFPAVKDGRCIKEQVPIKKVNGMQGWVLNMRKAKFQDVRVRRAFDLAFDFEWSNANLFFGQYTRSRSYFNNSEMEAKGLPSPEELALLEPLKDKLPPEVFTTEYANPVNADATARRKNLREAAKLSSEAGWTAAKEGGKNVLKNAAGETLSVEFLLYSPLFERIALPFKEQLELIGFAVTIRTIDTTQYQKRVQSFDYECIVGSFGQSLSPGNEQRFYFGTESADKNGSSNYVGIKNPAIDALIEKVIFAKDRAALVVACKALDRALIWNHYVSPHWFIPYERIAYWNRFGRPEKLPDYNLGFPSIWWWDEEKAKKTAAG